MGCLCFIFDWACKQGKSIAESGDSILMFERNILSFLHCCCHFEVHQDENFERNYELYFQNAKNL